MASILSLFADFVAIVIQDPADDDSEGLVANGILLSQIEISCDA